MEPDPGRSAAAVRSVLPGATVIGAERRVSTDHANVSVAVDDRWLVKWFRRPIAATDLHVLELLTERGYRRIVVAGDSAGGYLCGKVIELAEGAGLPAPTAWIGYSPWLDLDADANPDRSSRSDSYLSIGKMRTLVPLLDRGPVALAGIRNLVDVDPRRFPPTILITAENEMLEPDAIVLAERLMAAAVEVQLHSYAWQVHAFPMLIEDLPESREALRLTADFATAAVRAARNTDTRGADARDEQVG